MILKFTNSRGSIVAKRMLDLTTGEKCHILYLNFNYNKAT